VTTEPPPPVELSPAAVAEAKALTGRHGIGVLGYGKVARRWQVPSYQAAGLDVVAVCDTDSAARDIASAAVPDARVYATLNELFADDAVTVVDLATRPTGRLDLIREIVTAGKHVLAQKPLAAGVQGIADLAELADRSGVRVAVNQNGRFAPAWRETGWLLQTGRIGTVRAITHTFDTALSWVPDPVVQGTDQFLLFDYSNHWIDVSRHWFGADPVVVVQAMTYDAGPDANGVLQQTGWISLETASGANALIRAAAAGRSHAGHRFIVQGELGTIRGDVDTIEDEYVEVDTGSGRDGGAGRERMPIEGGWFPDGFLGSMVALLQAVEVGRQPDHSLADNVYTVAIVAAACESARRGGARVETVHPD